MALFEYTSSLDSILGTEFGTRDGTVTMIQPVRFDDKKHREYQIQNITLSQQIPNIYSYGNFNNTTMQISNDSGVTYSTVQFSNGIYTVQMIQDTITNAFLKAGWITDITKIPIIVNYNPATSLIYVILDSANLSAGMLGVNFGSSSMWQMLGFDTAAHSEFVLDGTYSAQLPPQIDWQGSSINVSCSIVQYARSINGTFSNVVARVPIVTSSTSNEIVYPSGVTGNISMPFVAATIPSDIMSFTVQFKTPTGLPVVWLYGGISFQIIIRDRKY
jgi:hypothetical protein